MSTNVENRLADPAFFIPDPWTQTEPDNFSSRLLSSALRKLINTNTDKRFSLGANGITRWSFGDIGSGGAKVLFWRT